MVGPWLSPSDSANQPESKLEWHPGIQESRKIRKRSRMFCFSLVVQSKSVSLGLGCYSSQDISSGLLRTTCKSPVIPAKNCGEIPLNHLKIFNSIQIRTRFLRKDQR